MPAFSAKEFLRYSRHLQLANFGAQGQLALKSSHAAVIGCGGLGAPVAQYLAAAGTGKLTLIDGDNVELSNLQRQVLFKESDIGRSKARCAAQQLGQLNSNITIDAVESHLSPDNCENLLMPADIIVDCTDNFAARYLINDSCKRFKKPWVYASIFQYSGQLAVFSPEGPCFRCLFPEPPINTPDCNTAGVLGALPGVLGSMQAAETIKILAGTESALKNQLLMVETTDMLFQKFAMQSASSCPACEGKKENLEPEAFYSPACSSAAPQAPTIGAKQLEQWLHHNGKEYRLVDVRTATERQAFNIAGEHIEFENLDDYLASFHDAQTLIFYCQSGARSNTAAVRALENGLQAFSLEGGLQNYVHAMLSEHKTAP